MSDQTAGDEPGTCPTITRRPTHPGDIASAVGRTLAIPWWPILAQLCRSYLAESFPTQDDLALIFSFAIALCASFAIMTCQGTRTGNASAARHFATAFSTAGLSLAWVQHFSPKPTWEAQSLEAMFLGVACACLVAAWTDRQPGFAGRRTVVETAARFIATASLVFLGTMASEIVVLATSTVATAISIAMLYGKQSSSTAVEPACGHEVNKLFIASRSRFRARLSIASAFVAFSFSAMLLRFLSATYERLPESFFLWGLAGVAFFMVAAVITSLRDHEIEGASTFRITMITAIPAFFPMDPGSQFSIVFAIAGSLLSLFAFVSSLSLLYAEAGSLIDCDDRAPTAVVGCLGLSLGLLAGLLMGWFGGCPHPSGRFGTIGISLQGLFSIVLTFLATSVLVERGSLRELKFLRAGKLPMSYTLVEESDARKEARPDLLGRCRELALAGGLTQRESEVLVVLARGNSLSKVQEELFISQGTAITHRNNIYRKLGIHSRQELLDLIADAAMQGHESSGPAAEKPMP